jgi:hypothetical protein
MHFCQFKRFLAIGGLDDVAPVLFKVVAQNAGSWLSNDQVFIECAEKANRHPLVINE